MAARLSASSTRSGPRRIYVCPPGADRPYYQERIDRVLGDIVREGDRLLYPGPDATSLGVLRFAERFGLLADPIALEERAPDLIVIVVDPLADSADALAARALAADGDSDLVIVELPDRPR